jgi:thiol peroxidase
MATITLKGNEIHTNGALPTVGSKAPTFLLVGADLSEKRLEDFAGKKKILTINPSYDTGICQKAATAFNQAVGERADAVVLMISCDLPFAMKRFCETEGITNVHAGSDFRFRDLGEGWGAAIAEGPMQGTHCRAVWVIDKEGVVRYHELTPELGSQPDYDAALNAARELL